MSFEFDAGRFVITDGAATVIDSNRNNFVVAGFMSGSFTVPNTTYNGVNSVTRIDLGAAPSSATDVFGLINVSQGTNYSDAGAVVNTEHNIGGTFILYAAQAKMYPDATRYETYLTGNADLAVMTTLEIKISGGRLVADIARYGPYDGENSGATPVYSRNATVRYYAFLVSFDN